MSELSARERIILSVDTSNEAQAEKLARVAQQSGARFIKMGLELSTARSWDYCAELAARHGLDWVADAKIDDIPKTVEAAVRNIAALSHPPFGITMHTTAGEQAMRAAQEAAGNIKMLGVTVLTSITDDEAERLFGAAADTKVPELARIAAAAGIGGIVCSPLEVGAIKGDPATAGLFAMIPGTRSENADHGDQARVTTPAAAIRDGADLLVIGRQITQAEDPALAYAQLVAEIEGAM